jgi:hypothetical protein
MCTSSSIYEFLFPRGFDFTPRKVSLVNSTAALKQVNLDLGHVAMSAQRLQLMPKRSDFECRSSRPSPLASPARACHTARLDATSTNEETP